MPIDLNSIDLIFSLIYEDSVGFIEGLPAKFFFPCVKILLGGTHN